MKKLQKEREEDETLMGRKVKEGGEDNGLLWYMKMDYDVKGKVIWTKFYRTGEG